MPRFVGVLKPIERGYGGGFLGPQYDPFMAGDPSEKNFRVPNLIPPPGVALGRPERRRGIFDLFNQSWRSGGVGAKVSGFEPAMGQAYQKGFFPAAPEAF